MNELNTWLYQTGSASRLPAECKRHSTEAPPPPQRKMVTHISDHLTLKWNSSDVCDLCRWRSTQHKCPWARHWLQTSSGSWPLTSLVGVYRMSLRPPSGIRLIKSSSGCRHNSKFSFKQEIIKSHQINFKVKVQPVPCGAGGHPELTWVLIINVETSRHIQTELGRYFAYFAALTSSESSLNTKKNLRSEEKRHIIMNTLEHQQTRGVFGGLVTVDRVSPVKEKERKKIPALVKCTESSCLSFATSCFIHRLSQRFVCFGTRASLSPKGGVGGTNIWQILEEQSGSLSPSVSCVLIQTQRPHSTARQSAADQFQVIRRP